MAASDDSDREHVENRLQAILLQMPSAEDTAEHTFLKITQSAEEVEGLHPEFAVGKQTCRTAQDLSYGAARQGCGDATGEVVVIPL
ncbi:MAG: hypothetical protein M1820_009024 [Bogoriella megaspora]|nr:MAG: hypothetical protein M1820_009024 [Bogoriella megaspora]